MGTLTKTFVILNLVFSIAFVMVSATVLSQRQHWKVKFNNMEGKYETEKSKWVTDNGKLKQQNENLLAERNDEVEKAAKLRTDLDTSKETVAQQKDDLNEWKKKEEDANRRVELLSQNVNRLASDFAAAEKARDEARGALTSARAELSTLNLTVLGQAAKVANLDFNLKTLNDRYRAATQQIKYQKQVMARVGGIAPGALRDAMKGTTGGVPVLPAERIRAVVRAVDPNAKLVVLNVGSKSTPAVKKGYRFLVYRGRGGFVARISVTSVEGELCTAKVIDPPTGQMIRVGDSAISQTY